MRNDNVVVLLSDGEDNDYDVQIVSEKKMPKSNSSNNANSFEMISSSRKTSDDVLFINETVTGNSLLGENMFPSFAESHLFRGIIY
jgi:hypothetical protein